MLCIIGTRPQIIKAAILSKYVDLDILYTGQHYDGNMSTDLAEELGVDISRNLRTVTLGEMIHEAEKRIGGDVLVFGDTRSTLGGALAAKERGVKLYHVEAGLRSGLPTPEERYRILTDHCADELFCPTITATHNLFLEGLTGHLTGDVMYDALEEFSPKAVQGEYILATIHRQENMKNLEKIISALRELENVVFPLHPHTQKEIERRNIDVSGIDFLPPQTYLRMLALERGAKVIITDSGGVQREAYYYGVPCVVVREATEWIETVTSGWSTLTPPENIVHTTKTALRGGERKILTGACEKIERLVKHQTTVGNGLPGSQEVHPFHNPRPGLALPG